MKHAPNRVRAMPAIYTFDNASSSKKKHIAVNHAEFVLKIALAIPAEPREILYCRRLTARTPQAPPNIICQKSEKLIIIKPWPAAVDTIRQRVPIKPSARRNANPTYLPSAPAIAKVLEDMISSDRKQVATALSVSTNNICCDVAGYSESLLAGNNAMTVAPIIIMSIPRMPVSAILSL